MNCLECEELIAAAARDGRTLEAAAEHVAGCRACWEFATEAAEVAFALGCWRTPAPPNDAIDAAYAVIVDQMAARSQTKTSARFRVPRLLPGHPALIALPGAVAAAAGLALAPEWVRVTAVCWAAISAALVSLVLMLHSPPGASEGDWR